MGINTGFLPRTLVRNVADFSALSLLDLNADVLYLDESLNNSFWSCANKTALAEMKSTLKTYTNYLGEVPTTKRYINVEFINSPDYSCVGLMSGPTMNTSSDYIICMTRPFNTLGVVTRINSGTSQWTTDIPMDRIYFDITNQILYIGTTAYSLAEQKTMSLKSCSETVYANFEVVETDEDPAYFENYAFKNPINEAVELMQSYPIKNKMYESDTYEGTTAGTMGLELTPTVNNIISAGCGRKSSTVLGNLSVSGSGLVSGSWYSSVYDNSIGKGLCILVHNTGGFSSGDKHYICESSDGVNYTERELPNMADPSDMYVVSSAKYIKWRVTEDSVDTTFPILSITIYEGTILTQTELITTDTTPVYIPYGSVYYTKNSGTAIKLKTDVL